MGVDTANMRLLSGLLENIRVDNRTTAKSLVFAAADEIDALRAENARLRERLSMAREFAVGRFRVVLRADGAWAVEKGTAVLNRAGQWEWEPSPSCMNADFLGRTRYTLEEALDAACALVEREAKECKACCGSGVRDDGRWGGIADTTPCSECGGTGVVESTHDVERCECQGG